MSKVEIKNTVQVVFNSLGNIEVKGMNNVSNLAGCMQILTDLFNSIGDDTPVGDELTA